ncbi:hypothetical protein GM418_01085 [Maribellus comscasis]|uniref:Phage holin family protein n=1 Tax=Maribellus comscasis TaxID=2681766 RepID=A0A6I6JM62_9BACT|nr:hypothetical protein [Maribellus comscasis]QGY42299.1 hypothetical protein GM418_01085 [Maribellus comscasis]
MSNKLTNNIAELNDSVKQYVQVKFDLFKLLLLKKTSTFVSYLLSYLVIILFSVIIIMFLGAAFAIWYGQKFNNYVEGVLIATGFLVLIAVLFIIFRKKILTNALLSNFSEVLFDDENQEKE